MKFSTLSSIAMAAALVLSSTSSAQKQKQNGRKKNGRKKNLRQKKNGTSRKSLAGPTEPTQIDTVQGAGYNWKKYTDKGYSKNGISGSENRLYRRNYDTEASFIEACEEHCVNLPKCTAFVTHTRGGDKTRRECKFKQGTIVDGNFRDRSGQYKDVYVKTTPTEAPTPAVSILL